jgi:hypothetical protein
MRVLARALLSSSSIATRRGSYLWSGVNAMVPGMLDVKGTKILAKSLFKELRGNGYSTNQILSLSTELIDLVTQDLKGEHAAAAAQAAAMREGAVEAPRAF